MHKEQLPKILEALIFASDTPLALSQIHALFPDLEKDDLDSALMQLENELKDRAVFLKKVAGGYQFASRPEYWRYIKKMYAGKERTRLTRAALETLAIIAFKQPISRVEVSAIRGVNADGVIKTLLERKLITMTGRDGGPGRALLFSTTREFLHYFGINEISDLPKPKEIEELLAQGEGERIIQEIPEESILTEAIQDEAEEVEEDEAHLIESITGSKLLAPVAGEKQRTEQAAELSSESAAETAAEEGDDVLSVEPYVDSTGDSVQQPKDDSGTSSTDEEFMESVADPGEDEIEASLTDEPVVELDPERPVEQPAGWEEACPPDESIIDDPADETAGTPLTDAVVEIQDDQVDPAEDHPQNVADDGEDLTGDYAH